MRLSLKRTHKIDWGICSSVLGRMENFYPELTVGHMGLVLKVHLVSKFVLSGA